MDPAGSGEHLAKINTYLDSRNAANSDILSFIPLFLNENTKYEFKFDF
jgi:hypothetical protein